MSPAPWNDRVGPLPLPAFVQRAVDRQAHDLLHAAGSTPVDFLHPALEPALVPPDSVSWQIFKNPVAIYVGGVAAVILELAEPRVRTGVWEHSRFRTQPLQRLQRTGQAAMLTVYGPQSVAVPMIAGVVRRHGQISGLTPDGVPYEANDAGLLRWVHATAQFGFAHAYDAYVRPLGRHALDRFYLEGTASGRLYGVLDAPSSDAEMRALFDSMREPLEASPIVFEFLDIMRRAPILPAPLRPIQRLLVGAAVDITPAWGTRTFAPDGGPGPEQHRKTLRALDGPSRGQGHAGGQPRRPGLPPIGLARRLPLPA